MRKHLLENVGMSKLERIVIEIMRKSYRPMLQCQNKRVGVGINEFLVRILHQNQEKMSE